VRFKSLDDNPLFTKLLPSLPRTVTPDFEYWVCVAYDTVFFRPPPQPASLLPPPRLHYRLRTLCPAAY